MTIGIKPYWELNDAEREQRDAESAAESEALIGMLIGAPGPVANDCDYQRPVLDRKVIETYMARCALCGASMRVLDWHVDTASIMVSRWDLGRTFEGPTALQQLEDWLQRMPERRV